MSKDLCHAVVSIFQLRLTISCPDDPTEDSSIDGHGSEGLSLRLPYLLVNRVK